MLAVPMKERGRIVIPQAVRERRGWSEGSLFEVIEKPSGDLVLRPMETRPRVDLVDHLRNFQGVEFPERTAHCEPRS